MRDFCHARHSGPCCSAKETTGQPTSRCCLSTQFACCLSGSVRSCRVRSVRGVQDVRCTELLVLHAVLVCAACAPVSTLPTLPTGEIEAEQRKQQIAQLRNYLGQ